MSTAPDKTEGVRTREEVIEQFQLHGISVAAWAKHYGFNPTLVYQVLRGKHTPTRGESHKIAVMLGLKKGIIGSSLDFHKRADAAPDADGTV